MIGRYLIASFFGGLIGACCALAVVYVTNTNVSGVSVQQTNEAVASLHTRINDFYIFAGIVITLLLAINVGTYLKADQMLDNHIRENFDSRKKKMKRMLKRSRIILKELTRLRNLTS